MLFDVLYLVTVWFVHLLLISFTRTCSMQDIWQGIEFGQSKPQARVDVGKLVRSVYVSWT